MARRCHTTLTTMSMPFVKFPLNHSKGHCTSSPLSQAELQAGVCTVSNEALSLAEQPE